MLAMVACPQLSIHTVALRRQAQCGLLARIMRLLAAILGFPRHFCPDILPCFINQVGQKAAPSSPFVSWGTPRTVNVKKERCSERPFGTYYLKCLDLSTWTVHVDSPMDLGWRPPPNPRTRIEPRFIFWGSQGP